MRNAILILPVATTIAAILALIAAANTVAGWATIAITLTIAAIIRPDN